MRLPLPEAVLVDHPAVPVPYPSTGGLSVLERDGSPVASLPRTERIRAAVQLLAASALLIELELWPGRCGLRDASMSGRNGAMHARLGRLPVPLGPVSRRLGGGESTAIRLARAVCDAVADCVGLPLPQPPSGVSVPGMALEAVLDRLLARLPSPLDPATARSLWAYRWEPPPVPDGGEITLIQAGDVRLAMRLAAASWLMARRRGQSAWLWRCSDDGDTMPLPPTGAGGMLVVAGNPHEGDLAGIDRWVAENGGSAVVVGRLPLGWTAIEPTVTAPPEVGNRLVLVGASAERCCREVERRSTRFDPRSRAEREALTRAASRRFAEVPEEPVAERHGRAEVAIVRRLLALLPDGVPESLLAIHTGLQPERLTAAAQAAGGVGSGGRWRLLEPDPLSCDPLHAEVLALLPPGDPRRLRHAALAGGTSDPLIAWCRERLDDLDGGVVREVLGEIAPGALGQEVQELLVESCLSQLDLAGARAALAGLEDAGREPWVGWMDAVDPPPGHSFRVPETGFGAVNPRCAFEVALRVLRTQRLRGAFSDEARAAAERAIEHMRGALARRCRLELAAVVEPDRLLERSWRRDVVAGHPEIMRRLMHIRALRLEVEGRARPARRLLRLIAEGEDRPGPLGRLQQDLGTVLLGQGRRHDAELYGLRAFRLLSAAGFRHGTRSVLFNLAVADLDALRIKRAEKRFRAAESGPHDRFAEVERVRLELARGRLDAFRRGLEEFVGQGLGADSRFAEAAALLEGVAALLDGDWKRAKRHLVDGGQESESWRALLGGLRGVTPGADRNDGWGVFGAARLLWAFSVHGPSTCRTMAGGLIEEGASGCLALALVEEVIGRQAWIGPRERSQAVASLERAGLDGWARRLSRGAGLDEGFLHAVSDLVDGVRPTSIEPARANAVVEALGVGGLEVLHSGGGATLWRIGDGAPGARVRWGEVEIVPLGGEVGGSAAWRLLEGVLRAVLPSLPVDSDGEVDETGLYGVSEAIAELRRELRELAPTAVTVALFGETGVGKDVAARALHRLSKRPGQLISVNVAAIPGSLLEAELFGSVRGAFTGADRARRGLIQAADGGTLFLDEIGDLDAGLQAKLLRFLESREVRPVGSDRTVRVDVRIVTATHHDLEARMRQGSFRRDLYFRIAGSPIRIAPLRERREDVPVLRALFVDEAVRRDGLPRAVWSAAADAALCAYDWPGNVRELKHVVEVALVRARGGTVAADHLPIEAAVGEVRGGWEESMRAFRIRVLRDALRRTGGNRSAAARELGISRQTLLYHLRELGLGDRDV